MRSLSIESQDFICSGSCAKLTSELEIESENIDSSTGAFDVLYFVEKYHTEKYTLAVSIKSACPKIIALKFRLKKCYKNRSMLVCLCMIVLRIFSSSNTGKKKI